MNELEVFFDYSCPYCLKGHKNLTELTAEFDGLTVVWRPCEAHPRPESHGPHSDLCIRGMFYARDTGADIMAYHDAMYKAALVDRADIEDIKTLAGYAAGIVDIDGFTRSLSGNAYIDTLNEANDCAYEVSGVWAIPSYRMNGEKLDAVLGAGVSKDDLRLFVKRALL
jgi:predicted DsbA family dithiol-disulfide isomerase